MAKPKTKMIATKIPTSTYDNIEDFALKRGMTASNLVRLALLEYLTKNGMDISQDDLHLGGWGGARRREIEQDGEADDILGESALASLPGFQSVPM